MAKFPWSFDEAAPPPRKRLRLLRFIFRHLSDILITLLVLSFVAVVILPRMIVTVPSGKVGVLWKRFNGPGFQCWCFVGRGTVLDPRELRQEGLHLIWPWDNIYTYDLRLQSTEETYNAISRDGVGLKVTINMRFQLKNDSVAVLHKYVGPDYIASVLRPEIGSRARQVIAGRTAEEAYRMRAQIEEDIKKAAQVTLGDDLNRLIQPDASEQLEPDQYSKMLRNSIKLFDTLVLTIELPDTVVAAINRKAEQFYQIEEYQYRIDKETKESERKQIEANGIAAFQKTVSEGISDSYLRWRGIEATLKLAESNNAKIVIIGSGKEGMPIILGNMDTPSSRLTDAQSGGGDAPAKDRKPAASPAPLTDKTSKSDEKPVTPLSLSDVEGSAGRMLDRLRSIGTTAGSPPEAGSKPSPDQAKPGTISQTVPARP
jgi:regulator of protease activity HflC (stomatin/prohibitin superfamily)